MRGELRRLHVPDAPGGRLHDGAFRPSPPFSLLVEALVGPAGMEGEEAFSFEVCSADWMANQPLDKGFRFARVLVVERWDPAVIERAIADLCRRADGDTWKEVAASISRYAAWEFEDYEA